MNKNKQTAMWLGLETQTQQTRPAPYCSAHFVNGCTNAATLELKDSRGYLEGTCCSRKCCNELAGEISEGTWCPFPDEPGALTDEQIQENMTYFRE